ncbi:DUF3422 family protein [Pseudorhodoplanes sinuspersici]|uniref:Egg lysin n=1 Tax=Pseudorhodoplanes sinuspersici TaxID=1235591 RepID=A0A1W6ZYU3_9HYPH|nr:DUF3422 domain-containing protein [Pseudorhodoplanes sinuspersici]ARQ02577.1 Egg lysin [Pseudorhodoplanes sinuspersici]RKE74432.1 putative membrane-anchored protein [Pseudorhodoplanes sinuspersici]
MSADVTIGETNLKPHRLRATVLGEVHARPFTALSTPARVLHFAFDTMSDQAEADRNALADLCVRRGVQPPRPGDKHLHVSFGDLSLRWEQHSEFTTYTWELPSNPAEAPFQPPASSLATPMGLVPQPGPLLVAIDLQLMNDESDRIDVTRLFNRPSLAVADNSDGTALYATDFQPDAGGFVHILVLDRGLGPERAGALVQRLIELETYRTLALLGLPKAQELAPSINRIEKRLAELTEELRSTSALADNRRLLDQLTALAAELEAGATGSLFRFGASRAYDEIVQTRLKIIGERKVGGLPTWSSFLARRMAPAIRTCATTEERQATLSRKLARAANLLRTRVDVELEQQNQELLKSMNARTRLQLRLQATVEGLSVAAISYYVVGLFGYLVKGAHDAGWPIEPSLATAAFVPIAVLAIWWTVRRIRSRHIGRDHEHAV